MYVQAVDVVKNHAGATSADLYMSFLRVPNLTHTKRLPGFCLLHVGMSVRFTTTVDVPYAVQDAMATVLEVHETAYDASALAYRQIPEQHGEVMLEMLFVAVLV